MGDADFGTHIVVGSWSDVDRAPPQVDGPDKQHVAEIFRSQNWDYVVWVPSWKLNEEGNSLATVEASEHLAVGSVEDYSDKAWKFTQPHRKDDVTDYGAYLPKSNSVVFERAPGLEDLDTPQTGLTDFARGGGG